jgi:hypothetical protein
MREITMFCSARDSDVRVLLTDEPAHDGHASLLDSEIICLEIGEKCTGSMCPVCAMPPAAVDARLAKSGYRPEVRRKVIGHCSGCDRDTELLLSCGGYFSCTECGTTAKWSLIE